MKFPELFKPGKIGRLELKNRMIMAPIGTRYHSDEGFLTDRGLDYYSERAAGGVGLIIVEGTAVTPDGTRHLRIDNDVYTAGFKKLVDKIHGFHIPVVLQINVSKGLRSKIGPTGPSPAAEIGSNTSYHALAAPEINALLKRYTLSVSRARQAGFDGIEIHGGNGYLVSSFLSPLTNKRNDEFGGDVTRRARFALELVTITRQKLGRDFPLLFRLMADEKLEGGFCLEEAIEVSRLLEKAGVDALDIVAGSAESEEWITPSMRMPIACNVPLSAAIKKNVGIPVIAVGRINDPCIAEAILAEGKADFIGLGRALVADPQFPNKALSGESENIRKCIGCLRCRQAIAESAPMVCSVNPAVGRERDFSIIGKRPKKRILVAGGGPAGMCAAILAAKNGHEVILCEETEKLGGQLNIASVPPGKEALAGFLEYLKTQLNQSKVHVNSLSRVNRTIIESYSPDSVIVATGSKPVIPRIQGMSRIKVVTARDVLAGSAKVGPKVIVVGGGYVGCETADFLNHLGENVVIVEILKELMSDVFPRLRKAYLNSLSGIEIFTSVKKQEITEDGMNITVKDKLFHLEADTIVCAVGSVPENSLSRELRTLAKVPEFYEVGDCVKARALLEAVYEGSEVGFKL